MLDGGQLTTDALFQILGNSRRRFIISYLYREDDAVDLKRLAALIAANEEGLSADEVTNEERQRVYVSLYQTHLPTLTDSGLVSYDDENRLLTLNREALETHCANPSTESPLVWYAGLAVVGFIGGLVIALTAAVDASLAGVALLGFSVLLAGVVVRQYARQQRTRQCLLSLID